METITISTKNHETYSSVSNFFIDYYMTEANGEFVKVYLYLVRLLNSGRAVTVAEIADHFDSTEKDICRAIKYWIKQKVLKLEYTQDKVLTGITLLPLTPKAAKSETTSLLSMLGVDEETDNPNPETAVTEEVKPSKRKATPSKEEADIEEKIEIGAGGAAFLYQIDQGVEYTLGCHADVKEGTVIKLMVYDGEETEVYTTE